MIHDIILELLCPGSNNLAINDFMSTESSQFLHPCELKILEEIIKIGNRHREILNFITVYSSNPVKSLKSQKIANESPPLLMSDDKLDGLYLHAFCDGITETLIDYKETVADLEQRYLNKPDFTLMFVHSTIDKYSPLLHFLVRLINGIKTQKAHGCAILQYLQKNNVQGPQMAQKAIEIIQKSVYSVFLKQLSQWLIHGKFDDGHYEFFIQNVETKPLISGGDKHGSGTGTAATIISDATSGTQTVWHYSVCYYMLPHHFSPSWAEKVLFIGQTVLMLNSPPKDSIRAKSTAASFNPNSKPSLFGDQEYYFLKKFRELVDADDNRIGQIKDLVDEIKTCVTKHLSDIALNEADLIHQLRLIKDYFLLGRGQLFQEFIKHIEAVKLNDGTLREINKAFRTACNSINVVDDFEQFSFLVEREEIVDSFCDDQKGIIQAMTLKYKVKWPLHLIFTPKVLNRYNEMFRFLLRIKKTQYDLQKVWSHHREHKLEKNSQIFQLRHKLMFLIDNLQYYLQADVLESEFSILMDTISRSQDFDHFQRAHTIFQANILSLCFLLNTPEVDSSTMVGGDVSMTKTYEIVPISDNPVYTILDKFLKVVDSFCVFSLNTPDLGSPEMKKQLDDYDFLSTTLVDSLLKVFIGLKAGPSNALSQLLLRLDFNYWFSSQKIETIKNLSA